MSDSDQATDVPNVPNTATPAYPKKGTMTEQRKENLEKARAQRKINLETKKYSRDKRSAAEIRAEEEIQRRAEELAGKKAEELLAKRQLEAELEELRAWKKTQAEQQNGSGKGKKADAGKKKKNGPKKKKVKAPPPSDSDSTEYEEEEEAVVIPKKGRRPTHPTGPAGIDWIYSYQYPPSNPVVTGNQETWTLIPAQNSSTVQKYTSLGNSDIVFTIADSARLIRTHQMYLDFTVVPRLGDGSVATGAQAVSSEQGVSRCFNKITISTGSATWESFDYDEVLAVHLGTGMTEGKRNWLKITEGFGDTSAFAGGARRFQMAIFSSVFTTPQALPIVAIAGGIQLTLQLAPVENIFLNAAVTSFDIENPAIRACMITPDPSFVLALKAAIAANRSLWLATSEIRQFKTTGLNSNELQITCGLGSYSSVDSIITVMWDRPTYANRANDRFNRYSSSGLREWGIEINGMTQPQQRRFRNAPNNFETTMVTFLSEAGSIWDIDQVVQMPSDYLANYYAKHFRFGLCLQSLNEQHGSGASTVGAATPNVVLPVTFAAPVTSDLQIVTYITCSTWTEIKANYVDLWRVAPFQRAQTEEKIKP
ncbi:hypothetical protein HK097_004298 [Rhizophlyctis rosea]|uniref:Uncharacterized protein n=1 Tax=Rhizophlyctis rosea TaxID=64517 RepID=A0AAD5WZ45_9FUNG|nr:hypothetical protein HK097_004298 [Rhizophlyctis rosea]